jgi:hypothetical protein
MLAVPKVGRPFNQSLQTRLTDVLDAAWVEDEQPDLEHHMRLRIC